MYTAEEMQRLNRLCTDARALSAALQRFSIGQLITSNPDLLVEPDAAIAAINALVQAAPEIITLLTSANRVRPNKAKTGAIPCQKQTSSEESATFAERPRNLTRRK